MYAIVVHGGAGPRRPKQERTLLDGVRAAAEAGKRILAAGGSALDAAVAAVVCMEDNPVFNAGTGSALNLDGEAEMDAGVMVGAGLQTGNVAALRRVRNPVLVARKVMEHTDHVLLVGEGALRFARTMGFADHDPITETRRRTWQEKRAALARPGGAASPALAALLRDHPALSRGTVGAVARDHAGSLAAATSTGGLTLKLVGRVGDTPLPGAGNYATAAGAVSATGQGELMMRYLTAKAVCDRLAAGFSAQQAAEDTIQAMRAEVGSEVGIIAVDSIGRLGVAHGTAAMAHAHAAEGLAEVTARMSAVPAA